jgi:hypothetical protein
MPKRDVDIAASYKLRDCRDIHIGNLTVARSATSPRAAGMRARIPAFCNRAKCEETSLMQNSEWPQWPLQTGRSNAQSARSRHSMP